MNENTLVVPKIAKLMRLDFVFLVLRVVDGAFARAIAPGTFDHPLLAEEIGRLDCISFISTPEDQPVAEIKRQNFGPIRSKRVTAQVDFAAWGKKGWPSRARRR